MAVARGWRRRNGELLFDGYRFLVWQDGKALEISCTIR